MVKIPFGIFKKYYRYILVINLLLITFIIYELFYSRHYRKGEEEINVFIQPGMHLDEIIRMLKSSDVIRDELLFKIAVKILGKENQIISNLYVFKNGLNNSELISLLTDKSKVNLIRFTIPPGYNLNQIAKLAEKKLSLSRDKIFKEASNDSLIKLLGLKGKIKNLEGFLYPDTYDLPPGITEKSLIRILFSEFRKKILDNTEISSLIRERQTDLLNTVTLASIIEGETKLDSEKPLIAGVYLNRIKKGMRLEADPTIQYILPDGPKSRLLFEDLKIESPYNTYLHKGLPPGPINNPSAKSILAALNPADHGYLFFVATGEGGHRFSETYAQHLDAIRDYKKKLREKDSTEKR